MDKLIEDCLIDKKILFNVAYTMTHIVIATLFVTCLKNTKPYILTLLLAIIVGVVTYDEKDNILFYMLPICGSLIYLLDVLTSGKFNLNTIWKIPYWSLVSYYVILCSQYFKKI